MKTIARRVSELEKQFAPQVDEKELRMYELIRESLRRLRARDGREPVEDPPRVDDRYRPGTLGEAKGHAVSAVPSNQADADAEGSGK
jgi:hypothetical protein